MDILVKLSDGALVPVYGSAEAAGCDLHALEGGVVLPDKIVGVAYDDNGKLVLCSPSSPNAVEWRVQSRPLLVDTGVSIALPKGTEAQIRPRSGLASKLNVEAFDGTIDSDYRGTIKVLIYNNGLEPFEFKAGDRIGQLVISHYIKGNLIPTATLPDTIRGEGGFGHTGI